MEPVSPTANRARSYGAFALRAGAGAAIIAVILSRYDARPVLATMARERLSYFSLAVAIYVAGQAMSAYRWKVLADALGFDAPYREMVAYYFVGMFTNLFVPGLVGGDAARSLYLGRRHDRMGDAIASVVADRGLGLLALFWLAGFAAAALNRGVLPAVVTAPAIAVAIIAAIAVAMSRAIGRIVWRLPRPLHRMAAIVTPYLSRPSTMIAPLALSLVLQFSLALCQYVLARGLGMDVGLGIFVLVVPIANVVASLPLTLNGLGVRETAYLVMLGMAGVRKEDSIALGLLWFAATMLGGLTGAIAFVLTRAPSTRRRPSE